MFSEMDFAVHRAVVVPHVEGLEVEGFHRFRLPQAQGVNGVLTL